MPANPPLSGPIIAPSNLHFRLHSPTAATIRCPPAISHQPLICGDSSVTWMRTRFFLPLVSHFVGDLTSIPPLPPTLKCTWGEAVHIYYHFFFQPHLSIAIQAWSRNFWSSAPHTSRSLARAPLVGTKYPFRDSFNKEPGVLFLPSSICIS